MRRSTRRPGAPEASPRHWAASLLTAVSPCQHERMDRTIDYLPLFTPVERHEVQDYRRRTLAERDQSAAVIQTVLRVVVIGVVVIVTAGVIGPFLALSIGSVLSGDPVGVAGLAVPLIILGGVGIAAWRLVRGAAPQ